MSDTLRTPGPTAPTPPPGELIRFDRVSKRFGENTVLDRLDFSVEAGKHVTLIGPSGSGKTTILRMLMTLTRPDEGTVTVAGLLLYPARRRMKKPGGLFQSS